MPRAYCPECGHKVERFTMRSESSLGSAGITTGYHCPQCGQTLEPGDVVRHEVPAKDAASSDPDEPT